LGLLENLFFEVLYSLIPWEGFYQGFGKPWVEGVLLGWSHYPFFRIIPFLRKFFHSLRTRFLIGGLLFGGGPSLGPRGNLPRPLGDFKPLKG